MDARIATALIKLRLDVNFGDPVIPEPQQVALPGLRPDSEPIQVLGYPVETVLAEKLTTAIDLAEANTRVRDLADIYTLTGAHTILGAPMHDALTATATFRNVDLVPLSVAVGDLASLRRGDYHAYRDALGHFGEHLPDDLAEVIAAAAALADPLITSADTANRTWDPGARRWTTPDNQPTTTRRRHANALAMAAPAPPRTGSRSQEGVQTPPPLYGKDLEIRAFLGASSRSSRRKPTCCRFVSNRRGGRVGSGLALGSLPKRHPGRFTRHLLWLQ